MKLKENELEDYYRPATIEHEEYTWKPEAGCFTADGDFLYQHVDGELWTYRFDWDKLAYKLMSIIKKPTD